MIQTIMKDILFLSQKAEPATTKDKAVLRDLKDTLRAHAHECVGMAANMIGVNKSIIIVSIGKTNMLMINPVITKKNKPFTTEEGCLSLTGERSVVRFEEIEVCYLDERFRKRQERFTGWTAQIIQHECDHLKGILI